MKTVYTTLLRSVAITLFSLSLAGSLQAAAPTVAQTYENMISAAMAKNSIGDRINALSGLAAVMSNVDAAVAQEINPEFAAALSAINNEARGDAANNDALRKMLTNATQSSVLDTNQKATVNQWIAALGTGASTGLTSQATSVDANAMRQLATIGTEFTNRINTLDQEIDESKRLEGIYNLLQDASGKTFDATVQEAFGRLLVKTFNNSTEIFSYLQQVLSDTVGSSTPLLAPAQRAYVAQQMLPRIGVQTVTAQQAAAQQAGQVAAQQPAATSTAAAQATATPAADQTPAAATKTGKKGKKKLKKGGAQAAVTTDAPATPAAPVATNTAVAATPAPTAETVAPAMPAATTKKMSKKAKKAAAKAAATAAQATTAEQPATPAATEAAVVTGDTPVTATAPTAPAKAKKQKGKKKLQKAVKASTQEAAPAADVAAPAPVEQAPVADTAATPATDVTVPAADATAPEAASAPVKKGTKKIAKKKAKKANSTIPAAA